MCSPIMPSAYPCEVVWRRGNTYGLKFVMAEVEPDQPAAEPAGAICSSCDEHRGSSIVIAALRYTDRSPHEHPLHRPDVLDEPPGGAGAALPAPAAGRRCVALAGLGREAQCHQHHSMGGAVTRPRRRRGASVALRKKLDRSQRKAGGQDDGEFVSRHVLVRMAGEERYAQSRGMSIARGMMSSTQRQPRAFSFPEARRTDM